VAAARFVLMLANRWSMRFQLAAAWTERGTAPLWVVPDLLNPTSSLQGANCERLLDFPIKLPAAGPNLIRDLREVIGPGFAGNPA
jgi:hypothetical protein